MASSQLLVDRFTSEPELLFNTPEYFALHRGQSAGAYFEWAPGERVLACAHFTEVEGGFWRSPARGTFGGFSIGGDLPPAEFDAFLNEVERDLASRGATHLEILPAPAAHDEASFAFVVHRLLARGYALTQVDLNYTRAIAGSFEDGLNRGNRRQLKRAADACLRAGPLPIDRLPDVHRVLAANRAARGYSLSMSLDQLAEMATLFPDRVQLFGGTLDGELITAALCLRISPEILYVFYWGDLPGHGKISPVVTLASEIYSWCQEKGIRLLDAGTSTIGFDVNDGLIQFKRGMGFTESLKVRMTRCL